MPRNVLKKTEKVAAPENIKAFLDTQKEKLKNSSIYVKSLRVAHENVFLYDIENMITETYVSELNEDSSIHGLISFFGKDC